MFLLSFDYFLVTNQNYPFSKSNQIKWNIKKIKKNKKLKKKNVVFEIFKKNCNEINSLSKMSR